MSIHRGKSSRLGRYILIATAVILPLTRIAFAEGQRKLVVNPYANVEWDACRQHKANLHTHTTQSDGLMDPAVVIQMYREQGYDILALTDHNRCVWPWSKYDPNGSHEGIVPIVGNELSWHHHAQSLFCQFETNSRRLEEAIQGVGDHGGLSVLNHPAMHWCPDVWCSDFLNQVPPAVEVRLVPALRQITRADFTAEAWFRTYSAGRHILMGNYQANATGHLNLELHTNTNRVRVVVSGKKTTDLYVSADTLGIKIYDGKWHHLAGVRQGKTVSIYLDGQLVGSKPDVVGAFDLQGDSYFIGRDTRKESTSFEGDLDDVRLWNRAIASEEIAAIFKGKRPGKEDGPSNDGLFAEYAFECDTNKRVEAGTAVTGPINDSAGNTKGPFHAKPTPQSVPIIITDPPETLQQADGSHTAFRFKIKPIGYSGSPKDIIPEDVAQRYTKLMERFPHLLGMEVLNGTRPPSEYPFDRGLWDSLLMRLMPSRPVWGFANDDMHGMSHFAHDWNSVLCSKLDEKSVRDALSNGTFFFSSTRVHQGKIGSVEATPNIKRVDHDPTKGTITIIATESGKPLASDAYHWIADGKVVHVGPILNYRITPNIGSYVRAELHGQGGITLTNPFGLSQK